MIRFFRALFRFHMMFNILIIGLIHHRIKCISTKNTRELRDRMKLNYARIMGKWMGVHTEVIGEIPPKGVLYLPNHRSYIDILVILEISTASFLAKSEVRKWPIIGYTAKTVDTFFVVRDSKESRAKSLATMMGELRKGYTAVVFPEGTTTNGPYTAPLKYGMFKAAALEKTPVVPLSIEYEDPADCWVGNDKFIPHFFKTFGKRRITAKVKVGPTLISDDWEELVEKTQASINEGLKELRESMGLPT